MDEMPQYAVPSLPSYIATLLGRGIAILGYIQSESQLKAAYKEDSQTILDNCRAKLYWSPEDETAVKLSKQVGWRNVKQSTRTYGKEGIRLSESYAKRELMTASELTRLKPEEAILMMRGYYPVRAKRITWYEEPLLRKRLS
jgi:type IV secretion system protein VirD4